MGLGGKIIIIFALSLFLTSALISYFEIGFLGTSETEVIKLPTTVSGFNNQNDFTQSCNLSEYKTTGTWGCSASGLSLSDSGKLSIPFTVAKADGIYTNTYYITSHTGEFYVVIADTNFDNHVHLKVTPSGLEIPSVMALPIVGAIEGAPSWVYPTDGTVQKITLETTYNINTNDLSIVYNGVKIVVPHDHIPPMNWVPSSLTSAAGVSSNYPITIKEIDTAFKAGAKTDNSVALDGLAMVVNVISGMIHLCAYSFPNDIIPVEYQFYIVFPQEFALFMGILMFVREG